VAKPEPKEDVKVKVLYLYKEENGYGVKEIEISKSVLDKQGKELSKAEPDIFAICINNIVKKCREVFEI
jgi:hypothetical protein